MRCLHCQAEGVAATATTCPACGVYLPSLLRDVLPAGTTLRGGAYRLDYPLGRGGFGITYRAVHASLEQVVAIKEFYPQEHAYREGTTGRLSIPTTQQSSYERGLTRFIREGRLLARLKHPGIVRVSDLFEERGTAYLVMDLVSGRSLRAELDAHPDHRLPTARVEHLVAQVVAALSAVHVQEVYHLDISPENILLTADGRAVLVDFGAARQGFSKMSTQAFRLEYAAPEVLAGKEVGPQSDLFELAMVVYELLRGTKAPSAMDRLLEDHLDLTGINEPWRSLLAEALRVQAAERPANVTAWWGKMSTGSADLAEASPPSVNTSSQATTAAAAVQGAQVAHGRTDPVGATADHSSPALAPMPADASDAGARLADLVRLAAPGTTIELGPGTHRLEEPLTVDKALTLVGAGINRTRVVYAGQGRHVVRIDGPGAFAARDLTFAHEGKAWARVVEVLRGEAEFRRCRFTGGVRHEPTGGAGDGLWLHGTVRGLVVGCEASANESSGILVSEQSATILEDNTCEENKKSGIAYAGKAAGTARRNTCRTNGTGIVVDVGAALNLEDNTCEQNKGAGIAYAGKAVGTVRHNTCRTNWTGIRVGDAAAPNLEDNTCEENKESGIAYSGRDYGTTDLDGRAAGTARHNTCRTNGMHGILVGGGAVPNLEDNTCEQNMGSGIAYTGAAGTARHNTCRTNGMHGILVGGGAPNLEDNTCEQNMGSGIAYHGAAAGTARSNTCRANEMHGISVDNRVEKRQKSYMGDVSANAPTLEANICEQNKKNGIFYSGSADGTIRKNTCRGNGDLAILVLPGGKPRLKGNLT